MSKKQEHIIFFDGICNLCNSSVKFIIKHDKKQFFRFASLQWDVSRELLKEDYPDHNEYDSVIYLTNHRIYHRSEAALQIARKLRFPVNLMYAFIIIPSFLRDPVYNFISRNRYKWFGKKDQCMIPSPSLKSRFLQTD